MKTKLLFQRLALVVLLAVVGCLQGFAQTYYSKVTLKLNGNNDINNLGTTMIGGKVYVGTSAEEAESCTYEYTSECAQALDATAHEYYLYAKADEGFTFAGFGTTASATTSFNSTNNPYKVTLTATSTDEAAPTEKIYYASFKYAPDNKPTTAYCNITVIAMVNEIADNKIKNVQSNEAAMLGATYGANQTDVEWHATGEYASAVHSDPYSATLKVPFTVFAKPNFGYEFIGWATTSTTTSPTQKGTLVEDYSRWYSSSSTSTSVSNNNYPGSVGAEATPRTKKVYAVFRKLNPEDLVEPTGETTVEVTEFKSDSEPVTVSGTTATYKEASATKNFYVDLVLSENIPYEHPGSDKNAKPSEAAKRFVTVTGANGNKSDIASYSYSYESKDLGVGGTNSDDTSYGTEYWCKTIRLFFPYDIKADNYTVHLPYGLYTTVNGNKTPAYEFTLNVTADTNPYLTIKSQNPTDGMTIKYKAATQTSTPDPDKGEFETSNITVALEFNEVVNSIDNTKEVGISLKNNTEGVNYRFTNLFLPAAMFGKVDGRASISYPELVNGSYTMTIPEGLFVGANKVNEAMTINFTVSGFKNATLKPYEMITDVISPRANYMAEKIQKLSDITISFKGEFGQAEALLDDASGITIQRYTEIIQGDGEGAKPVRTYYDVETTPAVTVDAGKMIVSFSPVLRTGMYEVSIPAALVANMDPTGKTTAELFNAGYAVSPAYTLTFNVESPDLWVGEHTVDYAQMTSMTGHGPVQKTTFNIIKEGEQYYLTNLLDESEPANKIPLVKVDDTTLKVSGDEYTSADEESYIMYPYSGSDITFVLGDDDAVTVPNTAMLQTLVGEEFVYYMFGGDLYVDVKTVPLVSSTPAQDDVVGGKFDIVLKFKNNFSTPFMNITSGITLKNASNATIEVAACTGDPMEQNTIYISTQNALPTGSYTLTVDKGTVSTIEGYVNDAVELSFYVGTAESADMVVTAAKYGTFVAPFEVTEIPEGVTASKVVGSDANGVLVLEAVDAIPAHTPVVIQSDEPVNETLTGYARSFNEIAVVTEGLLNGVYVATQAPVGSYVLQNQNNKVAFYIVKGEVGQPIISANRCYLSDSSAANAPAFFFTEDDATAISGVETERFINAEGIYNVNGVRMNSLQKGLNIIKTANGTKKIMIK